MPLLAEKPLINLGSLVLNGGFFTVTKGSYSRLLLSELFKL